jgi:hypothetical protein
MKELNITLSRNPREQNWSVEINGRLYEFVTPAFVHYAVALATKDAKQDLIEEEARRS